MRSFKEVTRKVKITKSRKVFGSTTEIFGNSVVNENKTGISYYDNFLNEKDSEYMRKNKNRVAHIEEMSPTEYFETCVNDVFENTSFDSLVKQRRRDTDSLESLQQILDDGGQFWLPYVNLVDKNQEGLHRMMVLGDNYGWDTKFPVLVVESADPRIDEINEAWRQFNNAQSKARDYRYSRSSLPEDFVEQAQYELERYDEETEYTIVVTEQDDEKFVLSIQGYEDDFEVTEWYGNLRLTKPAPQEEMELEEDELDWDDLDEEDLKESIDSYFFKS